MHIPHSKLYFEEEPGRRSAAKLLSKDKARRIAANVAKEGARAGSDLRAAAADQLPQEKRQTFIDRVLGQLQRRQFSSTASLADSDITDTIEAALRGMIHNSAA